MTPNEDDELLSEQKCTDAEDDDTVRGREILETYERIKAAIRPIIMRLVSREPD